MDRAKSNGVRPRVVVVLKSQTFGANLVCTRQYDTCLFLYPIVIYRALLCERPPVGRSSSMKVMTRSWEIELMKTSSSKGVILIGTSFVANFSSTIF